MLQSLSSKAWNARQYQKAATLAMMYGSSMSSNSWKKSRLLAEAAGKWPRDVANGPFVVSEYNGRARARRKNPITHKVTNKFGRRVHKGSARSCHDVCLRLNLEHAKWIMLQP